MQGDTQNRDYHHKVGCPVCGRKWREIGVGEGDHPEWDVDNVPYETLRKREEDEAWDDFLYRTDK